MAILKMKKLRVIAARQHQETILSALMELGCVEISDPSGEEIGEVLQRVSTAVGKSQTRLADANSALAAVKHYAGRKDPLFLLRQSVSWEEFRGGARIERGEAVCRTVHEGLAEIASLQEKEVQTERAAAPLRPWAGLDLPLGQIDTAATKVKLGTCPMGMDVGQMRNTLAAADLAAELYEIGADRGQMYLALIFHRAEEGRIMEELRSFGFSAVEFPDGQQTPLREIAVREAELSVLRKQRKLAEETIRAQAAHLDDLRLFVDHLSAELARRQGAAQMFCGENIFFFEGWVPREQLRRVADLLERFGCAWEAEDPREEFFSSVPVQLKNNVFTEPMNMVTEMYSLPAYNGVDPNPLMAPFFILFFGLMLADMGYGLLMILVSSYIRKKYAPKGTVGHAFGIGILCGVSAVVFGALTGGFFGDFLPQLIKLVDPTSTFALPSLFTPLDDALAVLIGSLVLGAVQIVTGMAVSVYLKIKRGAVMDAICGEIAWYAVFLCLGLAVLSGRWNVFSLAAGVILLVTQGYGKQGFFGKLVGIGGSLYNHITGFFSDILSYSRLMALMLAGAVIAQVFNTLGAITGNAVLFILISLLGNALNFGLNLLGCYVHDLRLQCLEYFGRFYEDGGRPFRPLAAQTRYVELQDET